MPALNPQHYRFEGLRQGVGEDVLASAEAAIARIRAVDPRLPAIFTLRHLSEIADVPYGYLRRVVARDPHTGSYRQFYLRKQIPGRSRKRLISVPPASLRRVQTWIARNILPYAAPSPASFAYHPGARPLFAAQVHSPCDWLLKIDIEDFFHSITEGKVFAAFHSLGYSRLVSFELARLTTMASLPIKQDQGQRWPVIEHYQSRFEGVLPQGAPTSPMLSNLVMRKLDERFLEMARVRGLRYTRYADDLAFSTRGGFSYEQMHTFKKQVLAELNAEGFRPNLRKTAIRGPGSRRVVLGVLVDGAEPRLPRDFKDRIRMHLHYLKAAQHGPVAHAKARKLSVSTLYHHVRGLIAWAEMVEEDYGRSCIEQFAGISWPPIDRRWPELVDIDDWSAE